MIELEALLTSPDGFGLTTASPLQRAVCRVADGRPLGELADVDEVRAAIGDVDALPVGVQPAELLVLSGIRGGKSLLAAALAVRASQTCDVSTLGPGETPRVSVVSLTVDLGRVVFGHIIGHVLGKPALRALLLEEPTADALLLRHPSGRTIEIKVVAGSRAGASLVARWSAGVVFDEAPRMLGEEDGVVNLDDARRAVLGRLLPGAQVISIGSPWAPRGPVFQMVQEHQGKPSAELVIVRAPAFAMNPFYWTPERCEKLRRQDEQAYRTDVLAEFADPETALISTIELDAVTRMDPLIVPFMPNHRYVAAMDPGTRGNAWTLAIATLRMVDGKLKKSVVYTRSWQGSKLSPLSPDAVLKEAATTCASYGLKFCYTDQFSGDALRDIARRHGLSLYIETITAPKKLEIYENLRTRIADKDVELPNEPTVRADLLSIRKRVTMAGVTIDLPRTADGRHADFAPAIAMVVDKDVLPPLDTPTLTRAEQVQKEVAEYWRTYSHAKKEEEAKPWWNDE